MLNSWEGRKQPLMGFKWYPTFKRGLHSEMGGFMTTITFPATAAAAAGGSKCFNNPNFVNRNNPSLLKHQDFYVTHQAELVKIPNDPTPPPQKQEMSKRKRKRKRKNKKKNKQSADLKKTESPPIPELTKSFKCISVGPSRKTRLPSVCESEDSFIVFDETDGVDESTEVSETEGLSSSDSCIPHKKVRNCCTVSVNITSLLVVTYVNFLESHCIKWSIQ